MTEFDPLETFEDALFGAAREERPGDELQGKILTAARAQRPRSALSRRSLRATLAVALAAIAVGSCVFLVHSRRDDTIPIGPERLATQRTPRDVASSPSSAPVADTPAPRSPPVPKRPPVSSRRTAGPARDGGRAAPPSSPRAPASLAEEVASLDRARTALAAGDAARALRVLDDYEHVLGGTTLTAEATLLRIEALARSGQLQAASELARRFVTANGASPLAQRARAFINPGSVRSRGLGVDAGGTK